jgi:beta-mannosidase
VEAIRRRWPRVSGTLPWQLADSFPNAWCTAAIDHRGDPKPAFFGVAQAYAPVHVCARFGHWAWRTAGPFRATLHGWSRDPLLGPVRLRAAVRALDGSPLAEVDRDADGLTDRPVELGAIEAAMPAELALVDLRLLAEDDAALAGNRYLVSGTSDLAPLLDLPAATVEVRRFAAADDRWALDLAHVDGPAAIGLVVDDDRPIEMPGWAEAADGWFVLLPGERRTVDVRWAGAPEAGRRLRLHGWNVDVVVD